MPIHSEKDFNLIHLTHTLSFGCDTAVVIQARRWFGFHGESLTLIVVVGFFTFLCLLRIYGFFVFQVSQSPESVLGTLVQSLASIFAIVFSISLVAVQFCSEQLSYRLIRLYVLSLNFIVPFVLNALALVFNLLLLSYSCSSWLLDFGILFGMMAIISLVPFFVYTFRFMVPVHVVGVLLARLTTNSILLSESLADGPSFRETLQPIEDIISNCVRKGDYAMAQESIDRVIDKMAEVLSVVKKRMEKESESSFVRLIVSMSVPFARLLGGIAVSANKKDSMEISVYIIKAVADFVGMFGEARFLPAFKIFDGLIDRIHSQARSRFSAKEYEDDFASLEIEIASARMSISRFVM